MIAHEDPVPRLLPVSVVKKLTSSIWRARYIRRYAAVACRSRQPQVKKIEVVRPENARASDYVMRAFVPHSFEGLYSLLSVKEVIQPQVPLRLPCYDFAPVTALAFGRLAPCGFRHGLRALTASMA